MSKFFNNYNIKHLIQSGGNGKVYFAETETNVKVALKAVKWNSSKRCRIPIEVRNNIVLRDSRVKGINKMLGYHVDPNHETYWIALEWQPMDLLTFLEKFDPSEKVLKYIVFKILTILSDMQQNAGVMQTDLKPENILIDPETLDIHLCDFGFLVPTQYLFSKIQFGTLNYMAPESIDKERFYPTRSIVWSIGIMAYVLLNKSNPPYAKYQGQNVDKLHFEDFVSTEAKSFVKDCLEPNVEKRIELELLLSHRWLSC